MTSLPEVLSLSGAHAVVTWNNVLIQIWEAHVDPDLQAQEFRRVLSALKRMKSAGVSPLLVLAVVSVQTDMPDSTSRAIATEFPEYFDLYVGVHEGTGFRASLVRAVVAGMALAARVKARYEVTEDVTSGARLLAQRSGGTVKAEDLVAVVSDLRERIAAKARA